jgi:transposase-like protein
VKRRTPAKCIIFLRQIKETCYEQIFQRYIEKNKIVFVSDKFGPYKIAFNKLFFRVAKLTFGIPIACKKYKLKHNNNPIERYNQDIDDRIKVMRNFGSFNGAEDFLNLKRIIHNFVNPHMQLKWVTPAEKTGLDLKLGRNKFLTLIKLNAQNNHHSKR